MIVFDRVNKIYSDNTQALKEVSFEVADGEFFCIVGPSGCGKSTLLKIIAGLETATSGEVQKPENISMVFQSGALLPWLSVYENVALGLEAQGLDKHKIKEKAQKYITMVELQDFELKLPRDLSGGQRQRVGLVRALAVDPQVLLLDEPFSALDTITADELHRDLIKIWQATKKTIVMVSHSLEEAVTLADRIMLMKNGRVAEFFQIRLPYPRREQAHSFIEEVHKIRRRFLE